jgi:uncharacterized membrane protein YdjX (TVP38/TMEM64 family)
MNPRDRWLLRGATLAGLILLALAAARWIDLGHAVEWTRGQGAWGPLWLALAYVPACLLLLPGSVLTFGGAYLFGFWPALAAVSAGSVAGASAAFFAGRTLLRAAVARRLESRPRFAALDQAVGRHGLRLVLLARLSPLLPFNLLNYALGLTQVRTRDYVIGSWLGMLPGTAAYCYLGAAAGSLSGARTAAADTALGRGLFWIGLALTLLLAAYAARLATRALEAALEPAGGAADSTSPRP